MKTLLLALCSLALALALGEGIVRVAGLGTTFLTRGALHEFDPEVGWKCRSSLDANYVQPGSFDARVRCNADGLRGGALPLAKPAGGTRIAVLGDSFMWGYGVEDDEVFAHQLAIHIPGSQSVNLAANGYSTVQELVRLERQGLSYDPDWTVLAFSTNDLGDNFDDKRGGRPIAQLDDTGELRIVNRPVRRPWKSPGKQWLKHNSRLWGFLQYSFKLIGETWKQRFLHETGIDPTFLSGDDGHANMEFTEWDLYVPPTPALDRAWEAMRILLARIDGLQRARGGRTVVVYIPSSFAMTQEQFALLFGDDPELDWSRPARRLGEIARSQGVEFVDLNSAFRAAPDPMSLFLVNNGHWSAAGHALAARLTAERMRSLPATAIGGKL